MSQSQLSTEKATSVVEILGKIAKLEKEDLTVQQTLLDQFYEACHDLISSLEGIDHSEKLQKLKDELVQKKEGESSFITTLFKGIGSIFSNTFSNDGITSSRLVPSSGIIARAAKAVGKFLFTSIGVKFIEGVSTGAGINFGNQLSEDAKKNYDQIKNFVSQYNGGVTSRSANYDMSHALYNE